ncbi:MAG: tRNA uridine-5-carboxymethylaminomethyl(34) synthesis GTPase MnmE [Sphingomonadales bacterium]|nr:tRNA uridine-5-carboxymethylaminomethyl(34) synthesis GTPase MnmE [Sphingomonadales bacterium]
MIETIFALSSGAPPAAVAVIRISGPRARSALQALCGRLPAPRRASLATLRAQDGEALDQALVLWMPGPATATGEDMAELQCHGGRAVVARLLAELAGFAGFRPAAAGEFTLRAFANGRIDLAEAEGLADLLSAETELQRRAAIELAGGRWSALIDSWRERVLLASAEVEAVLDFADEDDGAALSDDFTARLTALRQELEDWLAQPRAEMLREGFRVVIAGPPNAGKSTLFNALVEDEAAIIAPLAGTTRDVLTRPVAIEGIPFVFVDTAGLRDGTQDAIEAIGIERARGAAAGADLVLWLGPTAGAPPASWDIAAQADRVDGCHKTAPRHRLSALTGEGMAGLRSDLARTARGAMPRPGRAALNARQHRLVGAAAEALGAAASGGDGLLIAEELRRARAAFDALLGRTATEDMLDTLFARFCIGK